MFEHSSRVSSRIIALNTCTYNRRPMLHRQNGSLAQGGAMRRNPGRVTLACKAAAVNSQVKGVVITGGAKGLGYAMAREFLARNHGVFICARSEGSLNAALAALQADFPNGSVAGVAADVSRPVDVEELAGRAAAELGTVHYWLNNAGASALINLAAAGEVTANTLLADVEAEEIVRVVGSNVTGSLLGCRAAIRLMRSQPAAPAPAYHIFNYGFSAWGAAFSRSAATHKATKTALSQLTTSLAAELRAAGVTSIGVHNLSPGMVLTDLLLKGANPVARRIFNALAEEPEVIAAELVPRILEVSGSGSSIDYLNPASAVARMAAGLPQILNGGRFFDKEGRRVASAPGHRFNANGVRLQYETEKVQ